VWNVSSLGSDGSNVSRPNRYSRFLKRIIFQTYFWFYEGLSVVPFPNPLPDGASPVVLAWASPLCPPYMRRTDGLGLIYNSSGIF
jgi:hypothetical protein